MPVFGLKTEKKCSFFPRNWYKKPFSVIVQDGGTMLSLISNVREQHK